MNTLVKGSLSAVLGLVAFGLLVFVPAGTTHYWQGWAFLTVFALSTWIPTVYLMRTNPAALERRMQAGPKAETRPLQKILITVIFLAFPATFIVCALDWRYGWSQVPVALCVAGDVLVAAGLGVAMLVIIQNSYAAANVRVEDGQTLVSTGLYGLVRHPMYTGNVLLMAGIPLALGSYWGLLLLVPGMLVLVLRIRDEEELLTQDLSGYREYTGRVGYRLLPYVW
ncbi:isoprenylcysteine carboxylmethyltransferase family protein [Candidatus Mycobacterium wuenschmannii]|uniref:Isoprenylcysteine carboxylmethyltransferase family protein n=1 Tax=Candidatus Mycobacterium wuenschmannii TaxID=3027808 RepID=A0ABY8W1Z4_9MYCO|nr:isoprenylcysteine carboxylmethyltransferase family protein [Candidatus Mycobacterium wuenschmannii]WIM89898.1 isoprenylcysteine carboxylmethyltransferase family protein [Candidatus Mycobacterium wuenschmannii]